MFVTDLSQLFATLLSWEALSSRTEQFDLDAKPCNEFQEMVNFLSLKIKELKKKGFGNKPNALWDENNEELREPGAIGLNNPRSLLNSMWWINVTNLEMRAIQEQHDCKLSDLSVTEEYIKEYIEYPERQT